MDIKVSEREAMGWSYENEWCNAMAFDRRVFLGWRPKLSPTAIAFTVGRSLWRRTMAKALSAGASSFATAKEEGVLKKPL